MSAVVRASAGSGKTYTLVERFVSLVGHGAQPQNLLTLTFTVKAAQELRARVLREALRLTTASEVHPTWRLSAQACGEKILASAQKLKMTTIDALFLDWVHRFPVEAGQGEGALAYPLRLMDDSERIAYDRDAWKRVFEKGFRDDRDIADLLMLLA